MIIFDLSIFFFFLFIHSYNTWHDEVISPSEKFGSIYDVTTAYQPRKLRIQFLSFSSGQTPGGRDSEMDILLDNIRVGTPTEFSGSKGCGDIEVSSNTADTSVSSTTFKINGISMTVTKDGSEGFCYLHIPYYETPLASSLSVVCKSTVDFSTFVNSGTVNRNDRVFVASYGVNVDCTTSSECVSSLIALGGVGVKWKVGSSMVLMGRLGAHVGSLPMRLGELFLTFFCFWALPLILKNIYT